MHLFNQRTNLVPGTGIEPVRPLSGKRRILSPQCLPISPPGRLISPRQDKTGAGNETRTRDLNLGKVALYQLSYSRIQLHGSDSGGAEWSRTTLHGFAIRCITALLPRQKASSPTKKEAEPRSLFRKPEQNWSGKRDSNSRPQPWQGCALPTELFPHCTFALPDLLHRIWCLALRVENESIEQIILVAQAFQASFFQCLVAASTTTATAGSTLAASITLGSSSGKGWG
ncbi:MAG: hypothetical protein RLZZ373_2797 [Pseudomonadota bacterium]